eukprot:TRINITY_DN11976_c0_g1_i2.p1 TRINITY_DN11976_c0_g1~~TRINITY_DN11976_c0_g1_i2.p1  ORF type:complete len:355 (+),score=51.82 TRINITY_DN11976_c0_g1_i2:222-1286(+)
MWLLILFLCGVARLVICSAPLSNVHCRSETCTSTGRISRAPSLVQSRMQRTPGILVNASANSKASMPSTISHAPSGSGRQTVAVVQAESKKLNCSGQGQDPCLPLEKFTESVQPKAVASSSSVGRPVKFSQVVLDVNRSDKEAPGPAAGGTAAALSGVGSADAEELSDMQVGDMMPFEFHLQDVSLEALLSKYSRDQVFLPQMQRPGGSRGASLADLLQLFRSEIAAAGHVTTDRIVMNSIHGRFVRPAKGSMLLNVGDSSKTSTSLHAVRGNRGVSAVQHSPAGGETRLGEEVLIRFFYVPSGDPEQAARKVIDNILSAMKAADPDLRQPRKERQEKKKKEEVLQLERTRGSK